MHANTLMLTIIEIVETATQSRKRTNNEYNEDYEQEEEINFLGSK